MERKIAYLINPVSGTSKKEVLRQIIEKTTLARGILFETFETKASGNYTFLQDKIREEGFTDVVIIGGDGTVRHAINALRTEKVQFGIIPMGSGNGLAFGAGIPKKPKEALELIFKGESKLTDAFMVNEDFSCMLSGVGFDAQVAREFARKAARGMLTYTQQSLIHFFRAHPYQFEVKVADFGFFTEAFFISIANSNQFGNNVTIAPSASLNDGLLDIVIVQKMNKARLPFAILKQIRGNNKLEAMVDSISNKNILYFQTPSLSISNPKHAPLHIDGEPVETTDKLDISILKDCYRLIRN